ncbi:serine/threonine-protein kinase 33-like isoform X2 [Ruditapes philippinarum]|uniref:serine/threonine-protein kinase 33-like isoform X2 n=1 Tax=Ruditapes philippinarum TaxID=129788 RepID=UPI00295B2010|nr:serine/threonine-protein kinase 33-like isoform X2 [Ruditapes philippinarum]
MTAPRKGSADKSIPHTRLENEDMIWESYEIGEKLGQGAFGKVFQVRHKATNEEWAMKFINKEKAGSSAIKLLEREVAILKKVSHRNIIQLNEVFETGKRMFLVMELCTGGELAEALKEKRYFMESEVKVITKELASAITYLHKIDIVHRDLKLENILVSKFPDATNPEDRLQIKVTDFGLSITKSGVGHDNMMQDFCGTPNYMAPEIIDNKSYSQQCDVWALGVIVYTLFCGYFPFRSRNDDDSLYDIIKKGDIDFTDETWNEVSDEAKECIKKMLNTDPAHRLTASEVLNHHWITGDQARQSANVLELMKEWKDLKIDGENSAINGNEDGDESSQVNSENHTEETNNNEPSISTSSESNRKGSDAKKPGSGGKNSSRVSQNRSSTGSIPRNSPGSSLKPSNANTKPISKSPLPSSRAAHSNTPQPRPGTQNASRATPITNHRNTPIQSKGNAVKQTTKNNPTKK